MHLTIFLRLISYYHKWFIVFCLMSISTFLTVDAGYIFDDHLTVILARINVSYTSPEKDISTYFYGEFGHYISPGAAETRSGKLVVGNASNNTFEKIRNSQGCSKQFYNPPKNKNWIGLFLRGNCTDAKKVRNAYSLNASAVLLYGYYHNGLSPVENFEVGDVVVYLTARQAKTLAVMMDLKYDVHVEVSKGQIVPFKYRHDFKKTSVIFVSIAFVVLIFVSLTWLAIYYIQRLRHLKSKGKLARSLNKAIKKALQKIPVKVLKNGDEEVESKECCAICIDNYQFSDQMRILPCGHHFHRKCVDPWLVESRTCPMCKMDILHYYGCSVNMVDEISNTSTDSSSNSAITTTGISSRSNNPSTAQANILQPQISVISQRELSLPSITERRISTALNMAAATATSPCLLDANPLCQAVCNNDSSSVLSIPSSVREIKVPGIVNVDCQQDQQFVANKNKGPDDSISDPTSKNENEVKCNDAIKNSEESRPSTALSTKKIEKHLSIQPDQPLCVPCDIENLISEIEDLEESLSPPSSNRSWRSPINSSNQNTPNNEPNIENNTIPTNSPKKLNQGLPAVECHSNPSWHFSKPLAGIDISNNSVTDDSITGGSIQQQQNGSQDGVDSENEECTSLRSSIHVVSVSHS